MRHLRPADRQKLLNRTEKAVVRIIIAGTVLLAIFQLRFVTDPVDFYLKVAGDIDTPAFKYSQYAEQDKEISLYFTTTPEAQVSVIQDGRTLGVIGRGAELKVKQGTVDLDATAVAYPLKVNIIYNETMYSIDLNQDRKSFHIQLKKNGSL